MTRGPHSGRWSEQAPQLSRADRGGAVESIVDYIQWVVCLLLRAFYVHKPHSADYGQMSVFMVGTARYLVHTQQSERKGELSTV